MWLNALQQWSSALRVFSGRRRSDERNASGVTQEDKKSSVAVATCGFAGPRRFIDRSSERFERFKVAAENYPTNLPAEHAPNLFRKPFDPRRGHASFFTEMFQILNMIQELNLHQAALIVDVGAGAGWVTELFLGLGYRVKAIEPSPGMIEAARQRIELFAQKAGLPVKNRVEYLCSTIEELPKDLPWRGHADAVIFFETFHHVIDEETAVRQAFELLRPGGLLAICGDARWIPGNDVQAAAWNEEMDRYGTLESPFTREYMEYVLTAGGFQHVSFYHGINGLFRVGCEDRCLRDFVSDFRALGRFSGGAEHLNTVTAQKPVRSGFPIAVDPARTSSAIEVLRCQPISDDNVELTLRLTNTGETEWLAQGPQLGWVSVGLIEDRPSGLEARAQLPKDVVPGESVTIVHRFSIAALRAPLVLRLVSEESFWFEERLSLKLPK